MEALINSAVRGEPFDKALLSEDEGLRANGINRSFLIIVIKSTKILSLRPLRVCERNIDVYGETAGSLYTGRIYSIFNVNH